MWNIKSDADVPNPNRAVTLTLPRQAALRVYRPLQGARPIQQASGTSLTVQVPDEVVIVEIDP